MDPRKSSISMLLPKDVQEGSIIGKSPDKGNALNLIETEATPVEENEEDGEEYSLPGDEDTGKSARSEEQKESPAVLGDQATSQAEDESTYTEQAHDSESLPGSKPAEEQVASTLAFEDKEACSPAPCHKEAMPSEQQQPSTAEEASGGAEQESEPPTPMARVQPNQGANTAVKVGAATGRKPKMVSEEQRQRKVSSEAPSPGSSNASSRLSSMCPSPIPPVAQSRALAGAVSTRDALLRRQVGAPPGAAAAAAA
eukprot:CAMPEP_0206376834 /NCGR_PEP_ID=MMETSP0294-20121207/9736_1 /ASSEMBLY_ACC=CAM_ASM_000327 /TAXON_ID=39354 /ORGANISM="Heterosigma akashiwo, Strain CCMP2393" /LENGTH=254 /DNA_ID=CAMNT_0053825071 /DNA_START=33 /DNA_END=793 /DNA_ORIENTATION=-